MRFFSRFLICALSLGFAAYMIPGVVIDDAGTLFIAAILLGLVNAIIRPVLVFFTLPITLLTLGLFLLIINAAMLGLVAWMLPGFTIHGLGSALLGWIVLSIASWIASKIFGVERD